MGVVVGARPTGSVTSFHRQPSESDVVHDHIRLRQQQVRAIACIGACIGSRHMEHAGRTKGGETVGGSSGSGELSPGWGSTKMICDGCSYANGKVLVQRVGKHPLPTAQTWRLCWPGLAVAAPGTGDRHIDLLCHLTPGQALATQLPDLLCGGGMSRRTAPTHGDAGTAKLVAHRGRRDAQLRTDVPQGPTLAVQVGCTLNVHRDTVTSLSRIDFVVLHWLQPY
jgi:hypothetical protein